MTPQALLAPLAEPSLVLLGLCVLSRWVVAPVLGGGRLALALRLPGNLVHEGAHALGVLLSGFTVADFQLSLFTPGGRGYVRPGHAWTRHASPLLLRLLAAPAPLPAGMAVLCLLGHFIGSPIRLESPWTWGLAFLSLSMAAELVPSDVDFHIMALPMALLLGASVGALLLVEALVPATGPTLLEWIALLSRPVGVAAWASLKVVGVGTLLAGVPILLLRRR